MCKNSIQGCPLAFTHTQTHMHEHTCTHTNTTHVQINIHKSKNNVREGRQQARDIEFGIARKCLSYYELITSTERHD